MLTHPVCSPFICLTLNRTLGKTTHPDTNLEKLRESVKQAEQVRGMQSLYILEGIGRVMQQLWVQLNDLRSRHISKPMFKSKEGTLRGMNLFWRRVYLVRAKFLEWEVRLPNRNLASERFTQWLVVHHKLKHVYPGLKELLLTTRRLLEESKSPILQQQMKHAAEMHKKAIKRLQEMFRKAIVHLRKHRVKNREEIQKKHADFVVLCRKCWKTGRIRRKHLAEIAQQTQEHKSSELGGREIVPTDAYEAASRGEVTIEQLDGLLAEMQVRERHRGWTVNSKSSDGELLLHNACLGGHCHIARRLVQHGASVNQISDTITRLTPLMLAARNNHVEIMEMLLGNGARPDAVDHVGDTALHWSARCGRVAATRCLLGEKVMRILHLSGANAEDEDGPASHDPLQGFLAFINARNLRKRCAADLTDRKIVKLVFNAVTNECNDKLASSERARQRQKRKKSRLPIKSKRVYPAGNKGVFDYVATKRKKKQRRGSNQRSPNQESSASNRRRTIHRRSSTESRNQSYRQQKMVSGFLDRMENSVNSIASGGESSDGDTPLDALSLILKP